MRLRARVDNNQKEIVLALKAAGRSVLHLHREGAGCPDALVAYQGKMFLLEIKKPGKYKLTPDQIAFKASWQAPISIVQSIEEALSITGK